MPFLASSFMRDISFQLKIKVIVKKGNCWGHATSMVEYDADPHIRY